MKSGDQEICAVVAGSMSVCDSCHYPAKPAGPVSEEQQPTSAQKPKQLERGRPIVVQEDEDGYCEIIDIMEDGSRGVRTELEVADEQAKAAAPVPEVVQRQDSIPEETEAEMKNEDNQQPASSDEIPRTIQEAEHQSAEMKPESEVKTLETEEKSECPPNDEVIDVANMEYSEEYFASTKRLSAQLFSSAQSVPCHLITSQINALNQHITKLMVIIVDYVNV